MRERHAEPYESSNMETAFGGFRIARDPSDLRAAGQRRDIRLSESFCPADERFELLDVSLSEFLRQLAFEVPDREALVEAGPDPSARRCWTYRELLTAAETVARALL